MKKALTILTILLVLIGFAFAGPETPVIRVKSFVKKTVPAFQLEFTSGMATSGVVVTNADADEFNADASHNEYGTEKTAVDVADISKENLDLVFTVKLANAAKCTDNFTLQFFAGAFAVTRDLKPGTLEPDKDMTLSLAQDIDARFGVTANIDASNCLRLHFNGTSCTEGDLATFRVKYSADPSVDDNDIGEYYYADIRLDIISEI